MVGYGSILMTSQPTPLNFATRLTESLLVSQGYSLELRLKANSLSSSPSVLLSLTEAVDEDGVQVWQRQQRKGIWLKLPTSKAGLLLEPALQHGFKIPITLRSPIYSSPAGSRALQISCQPVHPTRSVYNSIHHRSCRCHGTPASVIKASPAL